METHNQRGRHLSRIFVFSLLTFSLLLLCACVKTEVAEPMDGDGMERKFIMVSAEEAKKMMEEQDDILLIDVRTRKEYLEEHIPGAQNIPVETLLVKEPPQLPDQDKTLLIYCRTGLRAMQAADTLWGLGFDTQQLYVFSGMSEWPYETVSGNEEDHSDLIRPVLMLDKHEPAEKDGIILEVTEFSDTQLTARFENQSSETFWYGQPFEIMVRDNDEWIAAKWKEDLVWTMEAYELPPGESREITCDLSLMEELTSGEYLLVRNGLEAPFRLVYSE